MSDSINPIRDGFSGITPGLTIHGAARAIEFYKAAFGAEERYRMADADGKVMHAELRIGNAALMLNDEMPQWGLVSPHSLGGCPISLSIYVADVDAAFARAIAAGATELRPVTDQFYGDRSGSVTDPFGYRWTLATQVEEVSPEEMKAREETWMKENPS